MFFHPHESLISCDHFTYKNEWFINMHNLNVVNFSNGTNMGSLSLPSARCLHRSHNALRSLVCARSWDMKTKQDRDTSSATRKLSPVQTDGTLLANNSQHCRMLHVASFANNVECCCMLLRVVGSCSAKFETGQTFGPTTARPNISFVPWSPMLDQCWINVGSIFTPLPTLLLLATHAHYTRIQRIRLLRPSHDALQVPSLLGVTASLCTPLPKRTQQCWKLLCPFASSFK